MKTPKRWLPPQLTRLLALTLAIVAGYAGARHILTPASFGQYGWYRGKALQELADRPLAYAGKKACAECHEEPAGQLAKSKHQTVSCEACHGAAYKHTEEPANPPAKIADARFCLRCHQANPSRPAKFPQVDAAEHFSDQKCAECHQPHSPTDSPK